MIIQIRTDPSWFRQRLMSSLPLDTRYPEVVGRLQVGTIRPTESCSRENDSKNKVRKAEDSPSSFDIRLETLEALAAKQGVKQQPIR